MDVGIEISTGRKADLRFDEFPEQARNALMEVITSATDRLVAAARARAPKRTGKLVGQIEGRVTSGQNYISGIVGIKSESRGDYGKAGALEYGANRTVAVKEHSAKLDHYFGRHVDAISVQIEGHSRKLNIKASKYLRGALEEVRGEAVAAMKRAIEQAAEEANS